MNTKQLRQKILDLAIRGKLVPQDPNDEPASVLLERIKAEKEKLIKEGKIKRDKNGITISHGDDKSHYENVPFELPPGWAWVRLSQLAEFSGGKTPSTSNSDYWNGSVNWTTSKDMKSKYIDSTLTKMSELGAKQMQLFPPKTLLMVVRSGILRRTLPIAILRQSSTVNQDIKAVSFYVDDVCEFVYDYFLAQEDNILTKYAKSGTTVESINFEELKDITIPLPPIQEQKRISTAVDSAFMVIDEIEQSKSYLLAAVTAAKSKILSLAIRGKLVSQDLNDEPASTLLERICAEREQLIKAGKIKCGKGEKTSPVSVHNSYYGKMPFEVPKTWQWYRLSEYWDLLSGRDLTPSEYSAEPIGIPYITGASNFINGELIINRWTQYPKVVAKNGDLLITCKGTVGAMRINTQGEVHIARQIMAIRNRSGLNPEFLQIVMASFILQITSAAKGIIPGISRENLLDMIIPCPPIEEQARIVAAVDKSQSILVEIAENLN